MSSRLASALGVARQVGLTVGAVVGTLCIVVTLAAVVLDVRPLVFLSGSMSPTIDTGALAIAREVDAASLEAGQVVSVPTQSGDRVTHRIQSVEHQGETAVVVLKGDANEAADAAPYVVDHADEIVFSVPWLGYVVGWLTGPVGLFFLGLYAAFLVSVIVRPGGRRRSRGAHAAAPASTLVLLVAAGLVSGAVLEGRTTTTLAAWTDPATVSGTAITAYTVPAPPNTTCTVVPAVSDTRGVDLTWPTVTAVPLSYVVSANGITTTIPEETSAGGTTTQRVRYDASSVPSNTLVTVTAVAHPVATASWTSPTSTWKFRTGKTSNSQPSCQELGPPTLTLTAPAAGNQSHEDKADAVSSACGKRQMACGTISDASDVTAVEFRLQRGSQCWQQDAEEYTSNCTAWQPADIAGTATLGAAWENSTSRQNLAGVAFNGPGTYTFTVRATDTWGNVATVARSFTLS